jgi:hypothetical protein
VPAVMRWAFVALGVCSALQGVVRRDALYLGLACVFALQAMAAFRKQRAGKEWWQAE